MTFFDNESHPPVAFLHPPGGRGTQTPWGPHTGSPTPEQIPSLVLEVSSLVASVSQKSAHSPAHRTTVEPESASHVASGEQRVEGRV